MHDFLFDRRECSHIETNKIEDIEEFELEYIDAGLLRIEKTEIEEKNVRSVC